MGKDERKLESTLQLTLFVQLIGLPWPVSMMLLARYQTKKSRHLSESPLNNIGTLCVFNAKVQFVVDYNKIMRHILTIPQSCIICRRPVNGFREAASEKSFPSP